ncbi:MAG: GTP-binding protein [Deltaproteobacteria bacterium]|nr:MAG: GTP-binding protein [Deltaproteobacteria bacterium]
MRLGIIGQSGAGKQTIFEALTRIGIAPGDKNEDHVGTIQVPDERVDYLCRLYQPRRVAYAQVEYFLAGYGKQADASRKETDTAGDWARIRTCDALIVVLRNFALYGSDAPTPDHDFSALETDMILADLVVVEKRLERLEKDQKRGKKPNPDEYELLTRCRGILEQETPLRNEPEIASSPLLKGFTLLTAKPILVLFNNSDDNPTPPELTGALAAETCLAIRGQLERELSQMDADEAALFFEEYQIENTAADRIIQHSYAILGAAGAIHSDIKKGFIRAEVLAYDDLTDAGSYKEARKRGTVRLEGKTYPVKDGDIVNFRFNV